MAMATEDGGITTAVPHFEQAPRFPASLAGTLIRWPLGHENVIVAAGARAPSTGDAAGDT